MKAFAILGLVLPFAAQAGPTSKCIVDERNDLTTYHFSYEESNADIGTISALFNYGISPVTNTTERFGGAYSSLKVHIGPHEVFSQTLSVIDGTVRKTMHWGPVIQGASIAILNITNTTINGIIDKRAFVVKDKIISFLDGGKPPAITFPQNLQDTMSVFSERMIKDLKLCTFKNASISRVVEPVFIQQRTPAPRDPGHHSWTYSSSSCRTCKVSAMVVVTAAEAACVASTCWWSFGAGCIACTIAAASASGAAIEGCEWSGACCPITCGAGSFPLNPPSCCFGNEICLDQHGQCCSSGKSACAGMSCCSAGQFCIPAGKQRGTCCPTPQCGDSCCSDGTRCVSQSCCRTEDACGNTCCNPIDPDPSAPNFLLQYCFDGSRSLCCDYGEVEVGHSGICCPSGQELINGICCSHGSTICGGECCLGTCQRGKCSWSISDAECIALGWSGGACQFHYPSHACWDCIGGCCSKGIF